MKIAGEEHLPLGSMHRCFPDYWDSPSIAHNLKWAFEGFLSHPRLASAGKQITQTIATSNGGNVPEPGGPFFTKAKNFPKLVYGILMEDNFNISNKVQLGDILQQRLTKLFHPFELDFEDRIDVVSILDLLSQLRSSDSLKILKTWLNGWVTSHRMHEDTLHNCLLGCSGQPDSLAHYVQCPHLFALQRFLLQDCSPDPLIRLGLIYPSVDTCKAISCTFSAYHAVKATIRALQLNNATISSDFSSGHALRSNWSVFAQSFSAEAGELSVQCRAFSLPKFLSFLTNGCVHQPLLIPTVEQPAHRFFYGACVPGPTFRHLTQTIVCP